MTATTLYSTTIPVLRRGLVNLAACVAKAAEHFEAQGTPESEWLNAALAPDMFPLTRQIQTTSDAAKNMAARLAGQEPPAMPDVETSVAELQARIDRTIAYLDSVPASAIEGREDEAVELKLPKATIRFTAAGYANDFGLPNFYFHIVTAYGILRHKGAPLGKIDYLGALDIVPHD